MGFFSQLQRSKNRPQCSPPFLQATSHARSSKLTTAGFVAFRSLQPTDPSRRVSSLRSLCAPSFVARIPPSSSEPFFQAGMTRSTAERVVEAIKHEQVRDETKPKQDRYDLGRFGISNGRSSKMRVWRNSDGGPPSWTVRLEGLRVGSSRFSPGLSSRREARRVPGITQLGKTDAETATVAAREVRHAAASHEAEMLARELCAVILSRRDDREGSLPRSPIADAVSPDRTGLAALALAAAATAAATFAFPVPLPFPPFLLLPRPLFSPATTQHRSAVPPM